MDEMSEMHEHAESVEKDSAMLPVSFAAALLAVLVAMATLLGHRAHTEELLLQNKATDTWAEYQAKNIRQSNYEALASVMAVVAVADKPRAEATMKQFHEKSEKYAKDKEELQKAARELEAEMAVVQRKA